MLIDTKLADNRLQINAGFLLITVFVTGASILIIELIGTRVLAPYFGSGIYTWSALIAVTLAALSLGYVLGGKFADNYPNPSLLYFLCLIAGLWTALTPALATLLLPDLMQLADIRLGVLVSSVLLFTPNLFVLGMAGPFAIRLFSSDHEASGRTSGLVFSISTLGSLLAALGTGFILVPNYGVLTILIFSAIALIVVAMLGFLFLKYFAMGLVSLMAAALCFFYFPTTSTQYSSLEIIDSSPSFYGQVQVVRKDGYKILLVDGIGQNYVTDKSEEALSYINFLSSIPMARKLPDEDPGSSLVIGLGAGQLPMLLKKSGLAVETVEIDPVIDVMARKHFGFNHSKDNVHFVDGRLYLSQTTSSYDYIIIDAFNADQIAWHLLSREALQIARLRLKEHGLLAINITSFTSGDDIASLQKTLKTVFPFVRIFAENPDAELTSIIFLASDSPVNLNDNFASLTPVQKFNINRYVKGELDEPDRRIVLSDNHKPVDYQHKKAQLQWRKAMHEFLIEL